MWSLAVCHGPRVTLVFYKCTNLYLLTYVHKAHNVSWELNKALYWQSFNFKQATWKWPGYMTFSNSDLWQLDSDPQIFVQGTFPHNQTLLQKITSNKQKHKQKACLHSLKSMSDLIWTRATHCGHDAPQWGSLVIWFITAGVLPNDEFWWSHSPQLGHSQMMNTAGTLSNDEYSWDTLKWWIQLGHSNDEFWWSHLPQLGHSQMISPGDLIYHSWDTLKWSVLVTLFTTAGTLSNDQSWWPYLPQLGHFSNDQSWWPYLPQLGHFSNDQSWWPYLSQLGHFSNDQSWWPYLPQLGHSQMISPGDLIYHSWDTSQMISFGDLIYYSLETLKW